MNDPKSLTIDDNISDILKSQLNVEEYVIVKTCYKTTLQKISNLLENKMPIVPVVKLVRKNVAPRVKSDIDEVVQSLEQVDKLELLKCLQYSGKYILSYKGGKIDFNSDDLEVSYDAGKGHVMSEKEGMIVFIDINRNDDLAAKGLLRDLARNLQQLRKECGYSPTDVLSNAYIANLEDEEVSILSKLKDELMFLVRVKSVVLVKQSIEKANSKIIDIDGRKLKISLE